jgi:hypothetical protein
MDARRLCTAVVGFTLAATLTSPRTVWADPEVGAGVVTRLTGEATVARATLSQPRALGLRDDVFLRDEIRTEERSLVHVLMGGKALLTVRELSVLKVSEETGRVTIDLASGKIGLAVVRQRMRPGEIIEIRTPNAVAAVRGTVLVMEIVPGPAASGGGGVVTNVHLLHGALDVSLRTSPGTPAVSLQSLQTVAVVGDAFRGVRALSSQEAAAVTGDLKPKESPRMTLPEGFTATLLTQEVRRATVVANALAGDSGHGPGSGGTNGSKEKDKGKDKDHDKDKGSDKHKEKHDAHAGKDKADEHGTSQGHGQDNGDKRRDKSQEKGEGPGTSHGKQDGATDITLDAGDEGPKDKAKGNGSTSAPGSTSISTAGSGPAGGAASSASTGGDVVSSAGGGAPSGGGIGSGSGTGSGSSGGAGGSVKSGGPGPGGGAGSSLAGLTNLIPQDTLRKARTSSAADPGCWHPPDDRMGSRPIERRRTGRRRPTRCRVEGSLAR